MTADRDALVEAARQIKADLTGPPCPLCLAEHGEHRVRCPAGKVPCVFCRQTQGEHLSSCLGFVLADQDPSPSEALVEAVKEDARRAEQEPSLAGLLGHLGSLYQRRADDLFAALPRARHRKDQIRIRAQAETWRAAETTLVRAMREHEDRQRRR